MEGAKESFGVWAAILAAIPYPSTHSRHCPLTSTLAEQRGSLQMFSPVFEAATAKCSCLGLNAKAFHLP